MLLFFTPPFMALKGSASLANAWDLYWMKVSPETLLALHDVDEDNLLKISGSVTRVADLSSRSSNYLGSCC